MRKIQILGTGCPKCKKLAENAEAAAKELAVEYEIEKDTDIVYQILTQHELIIVPDHAENNSTQIIIVPWAVYEQYEVGDIYEGPLCGIDRN